MPRTRPATVVAVEVMLLWPRGTDGPIYRQETGLWPVFAVVLGDPNDRIEPSVRPLFELLDEPRRADRITAVAGRCHWSVLDRAGTLLQLAVHITAPVRFDIDVIMPARSVLGFVDLLADGSTIALTNRRHASRLTPPVRIREALTELVLLSCPPSTELAGLARGSA